MASCCLQGKAPRFWNSIWGPSEPDPGLPFVPHFLFRPAKLQAPQALALSLNKLVLSCLSVSLQGCSLRLECPLPSYHSPPPTQMLYPSYKSPLPLSRRNCSLPWGPTELCSKPGMARVMLHYLYFLCTHLALKTMG